MVKEVRIIFDLDDIRGIRYQCSRCGGEVVQRIDGCRDAPSSCPLCDHPWIHAELTKGVNYAVVDALRKVIRQEGKLPMKLRFEMDPRVAEASPEA